MLLLHTRKLFTLILTVIIDSVNVKFAEKSILLIQHKIIPNN